jgi:hypothetical protein
MSVLNQSTESTKKKLGLVRKQYKFEFFISKIDKIFMVNDKVNVLKYWF